MRVLMTPDYPALSQTAADLVLKALAGKPDLTLGLPTGNTPLGMYAAIVNSYRHSHLDFSRVRTFNLDEYFGLPPEHPKSYHTYMREHFFDHVRMEALLFDGVPTVHDGYVTYDARRPGLGLELRAQEAKRYAA